MFSHFLSDFQAFLDPLGSALEFELLPVDIGTDGLEAPELDEVAGDADRGRPQDAISAFFAAQLASLSKGWIWMATGISQISQLVLICTGGRMSGLSPKRMQSLNGAAIGRFLCDAVLVIEYRLQLFSTRGIVEASGCS